MTTIPPRLAPSFQQATQDKHLQKDEGKNLQQLLAQENLSPEDKQLLSVFIQELENKTRTGKLFSDGQLSPKEYAQVSQSLGKIQNQELARELNTATLDMLNPQEQNEARARAQGKFNPKGVDFYKAGANKGWHTRQFADYDKKYGEGSYNRDKEAAKAGKLSGERARLHKQAGSSCGPTSALMVLKEQGLSGNIESIGEMRRLMGVGSSGGIDPEPIAKSLEKLSGGKLEAEVHREKKEGIRDAKDMLERMRNELNQGNSVILLTQYMDNNPNEIGGTGHYVVLTGIDKDNNLLLADPYNPNDSSSVSFAEFESVFKHRQNFKPTQAQSQPNAYVSVSRIARD
jgi:hypothetical protein